MNWMFWKKAADNGLPGPRDIPQAVGREIVTKLEGDPNSVWHLKAVVLPREGGKGAFQVRVFDKSQAASRNVTVKDYHSLTEYPDLILYEGWYNNRGEAEITGRKGRRA